MLQKSQTIAWVKASFGGAMALLCLMALSPVAWGQAALAGAVAAPMMTSAQEMVEGVNSLQSLMTALSDILNQLQGWVGLFGIDLQSIQVALDDMVAELGRLLQSFLEQLQQDLKPSMTT